MRAAPEPIHFRPAETVAEAVTRIFSLTGAAKGSGRGEKRAILALRDALGLDIDVARTNTHMARRIAEALSVEWQPSFEILTTVSLDGLNALRGRMECPRAGPLEDRSTSLRLTSSS